VPRNGEADGVRDLCYAADRWLDGSMGEGFEEVGRHVGKVVGKMVGKMGVQCPNGLEFGAVFPAECAIVRRVETRAGETDKHDLGLRNCPATATNCDPRHTGAKSL